MRCKVLYIPRYVHAGVSLCTYTSMSDARPAPTRHNPDKVTTSPRSVISAGISVLQSCSVSRCSLIITQICQQRCRLLVSAEKCRRKVDQVRGHDLCNKAIECISVDDAAAGSRSAFIITSPQPQLPCSFVSTCCFFTCTHTHTHMPEDFQHGV